jgi:hypothetical protein
MVGGVAIAVAIWLLVVALAEPYSWQTLGTGHDARPYWTALTGSPYLTSTVGAHDAYLYSPAFLQLIGPLRVLPWQAFIAAWTIVMIGAALFVVGPVLLGPVLLLVLPELLGGNITLLIALAIVLGFRWPAAWSFVLLTKVTPGVGLLWFAVRGEWRKLAVAIGATVALVSVSWIVSPTGEWQRWFEVLAVNAGAPITSGSLPVPALVRVPLAVLLIVWGARTDRRWVLPIGCLLAMPVIWYGSLTLLAAVIPLSAEREVRHQWTTAIAIVRAWWDDRRTPGKQREPQGA